MFESLSDRLGGVFDRLKRRKSLSEGNISEAMREIRVALLESDVALPVVKDFIKNVKEKAIGQDVIKSVTPGQMIVKIVHDELVEVLGSEDIEINLKSVPPVPILMVGLQGSGKTTTSGKLAVRLTKKENKKVLLASLDIYRPAAQEQLAQIAEQTGIDSLPIVAKQKPVDIAKRAMKEGRKGGYDVVILDTAGRLHIDEVLMKEVADVRDAVSPTETLLIVDAMTGQDAVNLAEEFNTKIGITGIALTRIDGDARGGAALSMRAVTGCPIKFLGVGEKMDALEKFQAKRLAGRILDMGDIVGLVEMAAEKIDQNEAEKVAKRMMEGKFNLEDMLSQIRQLKKMGNLQGMLGMLPGIGKMKKQIDKAGVNDDMMTSLEAIILSMTPKERKIPNIIKASRKRRIANGAGTSVQEVNKVLKQYQQMSSMMKKAKKLKKKGLLPDFDGSMMGNVDPNELNNMGELDKIGESLLPSDFSAGNSLNLGGSLRKGFNFNKFKP